MRRKIGAWDRIDIIEDSPSAGRTLALSPSDPGARVHVATWADPSAFETTFLRMLNGAEWPRLVAVLRSSPLPLAAA